MVNDMKSKKKLKLKTKNLKILLIVLITIYLLIGPVKLMFKGYSIISSFKINFYGIKSEALDNKYSKVLDKIVNKGYFDKDYLEEYFKIDYYDKDNFIKDVRTRL